MPFRNFLVQDLLAIGTVFNVLDCCLADDEILASNIKER